jgi:hypothetical protein
MAFQRKTQQQIETMNAGELRLYRSEVEAVFEIVRASENPDVQQWRDIVDEITAIQLRLIQVVVASLR